ncbi:MAG: DegT/DnrJ/EryC1/StrS family aminotransferase [Anaerolineae bacterium]|nr:DegT/DnrJ/EryC1/StrS family aminotransferase [Anaerolineae bacterium]
MDRIPLADLQREYNALRPEIDAAVGRVLARGWFVLGEEGEAFEQAWAAYCGVAWAVGVGNGTDAIELALRAAGIGGGDEVIVPALTATFTALAVSAAGATPVPADVDPQRFTLAPAAFEAAITPRTAAVVPVHLYGCPAEMEPILAIARQHRLFVLEDAAQAHGARYRGQRVGGLADAAAFSFYPSKNLGAYGDAGAVVTGDADLAERVRMLRHGGQRTTYQHEIMGTNSRLDEIQAAILRAKLGHLDAWNARRRAIAQRYAAGLASLPGLALPSVPAEVEHVFHLYVVRTPQRDALGSFLAQRGITAGVHYPRAVHEQGAYAHLGCAAGSCPHAEAAAREVLSLPIFPHLADAQVDLVVDAVQAFFAR